MSVSAVDLLATKVVHQPKWQPFSNRFSIQMEEPTSLIVISVCSRLEVPQGTYKLEQKVKLFNKDDFIARFSLGSVLKFVYRVIVYFLLFLKVFPSSITFLIVWQSRIVQFTYLPSEFRIHRHFHHRNSIHICCTVMVEAYQKLLWIVCTFYFILFHFTFLKKRSTNVRQLFWMAVYDFESHKWFARIWPRICMICFVTETSFLSSEVNERGPKFLDGAKSEICVNVRGAYLCKIYEYRANVTHHSKLLAIYEHILRLGSIFYIYWKSALWDRMLLLPVYISHENNCKRCKKKSTAMNQMPCGLWKRECKIMMKPEYRSKTARNNSK